MASTRKNSRLRIVLIVLATPCLTVVGLSQLGPSALFPGKDTGLAIERSGSIRADSIRLSHSAGDLQALVRVWIALDSVAWHTFGATLDDGTVLQVHSGVITDSAGVLEISALDLPGARRPKFAWSSGRELLVTSQRSSRPNQTTGRAPRDRMCQAPDMAITAWRVDVSDADFDSCGRARVRTLGFWVAAVLLTIAILGIIFEKLHELRNEPSAITSKDVIESLIDELKASDEAETPQLRRLARNLLIDRMKEDDALAEMGVETGNMASFEKALRLSDELIEQLDASIGEFEASVSYYRRLLHAFAPDG